MSGGRSLLYLRGFGLNFGARAVASALCISILVLVATLAAPGASAAHFLQQSEDNYKVQFISGNLTASVTKNWPRVDFEHTLNLLSPMFEISIPRLFLFNDTNGDGVFARSEGLYTGLMDDSYVKWNVSAIEFRQSEAAGEYAVMSMSSMVSLYDGFVNQTIEKPAVKDWARLTFSFMITERPVTYANSIGQYLVAGRTDLRIVMDLSVRQHVNATSLALEQVLQAGGSVYTFLIREKAAKSDGTVLTAVSSRVDDRTRGLNYTHRIQQADLPTQDIEFANEQGVGQAYYNYSSVPTTNDSGSPAKIPLNSSYYTTGTNLMLYTAYQLGNRTDNLSHDMSLGLDMSGFVRVRDWAMRNLPVLSVIVGGLVVLTVVSAHLWRRKHRRARENGDEMKHELEEKGLGPE